MALHGRTTQHEEEHHVFKLDVVLLTSWATDVDVRVGVGHLILLWSYMNRTVRVSHVVSGQTYVNASIILTLEILILEIDYSRTGICGD